MRTRTPIPADNIGIVCGCRECVDAGVAHERQRRVPSDVPGVEARWVHGWDLRRWLDAQASAFAAARARTAPR
jgi:hypothetical protein